MINDNLLKQAQAIYQYFIDEAETTEITLSEISCYSNKKIKVSELQLNSYISTENMYPNKKGIGTASNLPNVEYVPMFEEGDVLVSNIRPYFKKIYLCKEKGGCSADVLCFVPRKPEYELFLFETLYSDEFFSFMVASSKGTKMPRGDKKQIMNYPVSLPSIKKLDQLNNIIKPIIDIVYKNNNESRLLTKLRDTILPKIMSGNLIFQE